MKFVFSLFASSLAYAAAQDLNLFETVAGNPDLSTLGTAVGLAGFEDFLINTTDITVFAPTNEAFESLPAEFLTPGYLLHLQYILQYHVLEGVVASSDITDGLSVTMANGENITATVNDQGVFFSGAAFSNSQVIIPDVQSTNGLAHVVNGFFVPELLTINLFDLASMQTGFENVIELITISGLESELTATNRTVLAPSNTAFEALPSDFLTNVASDSVLRDSLLRYHVIIGVYPQSSITDGMEAMTALGVPLKFGVVGGGRFADITAIGASNNVTVGLGDLIGQNGIAHVIEGVLQPPTDVPAPTTDSGTPAPVAPGTMPAPVAPATPTAPTPTAPTPVAVPTEVVPTESVPTSSGAFMKGNVLLVISSFVATFL